MEKRRTYRLDPACVNAIEDIRRKIREKLGINIPFQEGTRLLGEKYIRGHLETYTYGELMKEYRKKKQWKTKKIGCI